MKKFLIISIFLTLFSGCSRDNSGRNFEKNNTVINLGNGYFIYNSFVYKLYNGQVKIVYDLKDSISVFNKTTIYNRAQWDLYGKSYPDKKFDNMKLSVSSIYFGKAMYYNFAILSKTPIKQSNQSLYIIQFSPKLVGDKIHSGVPFTVMDTTETNSMFGIPFAFANVELKTHDLALNQNSYSINDYGGYDMIYKYQYSGKVDIDLETYLLIEEYNVFSKF